LALWELSDRIKNEGNAIDKSNPFYDRFKV